MNGNRSAHRGSVGQQRMVAIVGLILAGFAAAYWFLALPTPAPLPAESLAPPPTSASDFENTHPIAKYVGSQKCGECHSSEYDSFRETSHNRSMSPVVAEREPGNGFLDHPASGRQYRIDRVAGALRHREYLKLADGAELALADHALTYRIGSGKVARTYVVEADGFLAESPVTWYAARRQWDMSPGYNKPSHSSFQRTIKFGCLYCHAGHVECNGPGVERFEIHETAIGCERCHGPGSLHVARRAAGDDAASGVDRTIVNPLRLSRELSESICRQCHFMGDAQAFVRGKEQGDFRPGLPLDDFRWEYRLADSGAEMTVVGHVGQLQASRCYRGDERLTCTTCHNPHRTVEPGRRAEYYRDICMTCHASAGCRLPEAERLAQRQNDCAACHMPHVPTEVRHVALTHHRIGVHQAPLARTPARSDAVKPELIPMQDLSRFAEADRRRALGLAYAELFLQQPQEPSYRRFWVLAEEHLLAAYREGAGDPAVLGALANVAFDAREYSQAEALCEQAFRHGPSNRERLELTSGLAWIRFQQRRWGEAREMFSELVEFRRNATDWYLLGSCHEQAGHIEPAVAAFEKVVQIDPSSVDGHGKLADLFLKLGDAEQARQHERLKKTLPRVDAPPRNR